MKVVIVGARDNPKNAVILSSSGGGGALQKVPVSDSLDRLSPEQVVDIMCMQERVYGSGGLEAPSIT